VLLAQYELNTSIACVTAGTGIVKAFVGAQFCCTAVEMTLDIMLSVVLACIHAPYPSSCPTGKAATYEEWSMQKQPNEVSACWSPQPDDCARTIALTRSSAHDGSCE
jgi:hypothetical protein